MVCQAIVIVTISMTLMVICGALHDFLPFVQFEKREKHSWRSVTFSLKVTLLHGCFYVF